MTFSDGRTESRGSWTRLASREETSGLPGADPVAAEPATAGTVAPPAGPAARRPRFGTAGRRLGILAVAAVLVAAAYAVAMQFGDPLEMIAEQVSPPPPTSVTYRPSEAPELDELAMFNDIVMGELDAMWSRTFRLNAMAYAAPVLALAEDTFELGCGYEGTVAGTFYCPDERAIHVDLTAYSVLRARYGEAGELAQAFALAHEFGHHVQELMAEVDPAARPVDGPVSDYNEEAARRTQLQADCFAGIWASVAGQPNMFEIEDFDLALDEASRFDRSGRPRVPKGLEVPTIAERRAWFERGYELPGGASCSYSHFGDM